ncbi:MAG TPA: iron ABC transporter permease [Casimicrobiaceae bacterium]|nr:iron ABC transporter permease [Casimicrobiaceae bacterium]
MRAATVIVVALVPASLALAVAFGSVDLGPGHLADALVGRGDEIAREIVWGVRVPRALAGFACGGLLALAGALLQVLLRNPLADPAILGVSGGAAAGALGAMLFGAAAVVVNLAALAGASVAAGAVFAFSLGRSGWNPYRVLLTGVALASGFGAIVSLMLAVAPSSQLQGMLFWLLGDLSPAGNPAVALLVLAACAALAFSQAAALDVLILGEDKARSLGVAVTRLQSIAFGCATLATVAAVLLGGAIGFVGLVVPHLLRLSGVHRHRVLLPLAACLGGSLLALADTLARTVAAPAELPVGVLTAMIGVPVLLVLLARLR